MMVSVLSMEEHDSELSSGSMLLFTLCLSGKDRSKIMHHLSGCGITLRWLKCGYRELMWVERNGPKGLFLPELLLEERPRLGCG